MTSAHFPGSVDFSTLAAPASGGSYVTEVDEASFDDIARRSVSYPVVLEFYSPRSQGGQAVSDALADLANAAGGKYLLARVNVDTQPRIAQAMQVSAVPTVVAILGGQVAPLFQGTASREDIARTLDQVVQAAAANGIMGRAEPVTGSAPAGESADTPAADPRYAAADEALVAGDYARAVAEFDKVLAATPGDSEAAAGRAQAALLARSVGFDPAAINAAAVAGTTDVVA